MELLDVFRNECLRVGSSAPDKASLLGEIAALAKTCSVLSNISEETILTHLHKREELGSTGFQDGIAIPHCLLPDVNEFVVGLVTHSAGIDFHSIDGKPTHIIPFIIGPRDERNTHIRLLSAISRILTSISLRKELLAAATPTALAESFLRTLGFSLTQDQSSKRHYIIIAVQEEGLFDDILSLFSEEESCYISIIEAHNGSEYLRGLPLFAAFWDGDTKGFHRLLVISIRHTMANDMLRRLDTVVGGLEQKTGVLVHMIDTLYTAGRLDI